MTSRWAGMVVCLFIAGAGLSLYTAGCDPCASCPPSGGHKRPTPTSTPTPAPNACLPSSSLGVLVQSTNATVYAPQGRWGSGTAAVKVVPIETTSGIGTGAAPTTVVTGSVPNSCSCNSTTGTTVCTGNTTDVFLINGTTLSSTLTSGATASENFSGGSCMNCGVVVDSTTNKALITLGLDTEGTGGYQFLDLAGNTFETPIAAGGFTSEDASIDPVRHLVLSPNEQENYQIVNVASATAAIFNNTGFATAGAPDSAAEDCTTGIALSTLEGSTSLYIADLTQAVFTPGTPGTWTDTASQTQNFPEFTFAAGTNGIAVAPGSHLGVVTGEFGGSLEGVIQLPATSGTGTPAVVDWVSFVVPNLPNESPWSEGFDPHTVTAYVSPNSKKAFGVLENGDFSFLAVVDLQGLLSAPRTGHVVNEPLPAGLVTFIAE
jgi:hypothetical protein